MKDVWNEVFRKPFSAKDGDSTVLALAEFREELYVGTGRSNPVQLANVYRLTDCCGCKKWEKVTPPWSSATGGYKMAMAVFINQLYIATDYGEVWRAADGENWSNTTGNLSSGGIINAMAEFNGYLYISKGTSIWRTSNGSWWQFVINLTTEDSKIYDILSLKVFNNYLYAGIGLKNPVYVSTPQGEVLVFRKGIQLWRTLDGKGWSKFQEVVEPSGISAVMYPEHVHALEAFNGFLYVGEYHGKGLYRTDGSNKPWEYISNVISKGTGSVFRLMKHAGKLYLGVSHLASPDTPGIPGSPLLYSTTDGILWNSDDKGPKLDDDHSSITSLLSHGGRLYAGTANPGDSGSMTLWELGPEIVPDQFESNNTFATATTVILDSAKTQTSTELTDLTLHENDVDFFEINYQNEPELKCFSPFKKELIAGIVAEIYPGFLSILVQEEYCRPMILEIYDSKKKLKGKFQTANEVKFICPYKDFMDQKLFLVIKNPDGRPPVRYKLSIKLCGWSGSISKPLYKFWEVLPPPYPPPPFLDLIDPITKYFSVNQFIADTEKYLSEFIEQRGKIDKGDLEHGLGRIAHLAGLYDDAERFYGQTLTVFQELRITTREAEVMRNLGELYSVQGKAEEAVESFGRASQLHEKNEDFLGLAHDRISLGRHYLAEREYSKSLAALEEALHFHVGTPDVSGQAFNLLYQSEAFLALKKQDAVVACLILAENLSYRIEDSALRHEVDQRIRRTVTQIGEKEFLALKERLVRQAETIRHRAVSKITGK